MQYALWQLWQSWGVEATTLIAEGVGEYTAAIAAGVFSLEDGLKLAAIKAKLLNFDLRKTLERINFSPARVEVVKYSNNQSITAEITTSEYWDVEISKISQENSRNQVKLDYQIILELGVAKSTFSLEKDTYLPSLSPEYQDWFRILISLAHLYLQGVNIDWFGFARDYQYNKVGLPNYPFQRQYYKI